MQVTGIGRRGMLPTVGGTNEGDDALHDGARDLRFAAEYLVAARGLVVAARTDDVEPNAKHPVRENTFLRRRGGVEERLNLRHSPVTSALDGIVRPPVDGHTVGEEEFYHIYVRVIAGDG